jgi:hypothetical protein
LNERIYIEDVSVDLIVDAVGQHVVTIEIRGEDGRTRCYATRPDYASSIAYRIQEQAELADRKLKDD